MKAREMGLRALMREAARLLEAHAGLDEPDVAAMVRELMKRAEPVHPAATREYVQKIGRVRRPS